MRAMKYEPPTVVMLGGKESAAGQNCAPLGSSVANNCKNGSLAGNNCITGSSNIHDCKPGTSAVRSCKAGTGGLS